MDDNSRSFTLVTVDEIEALVERGIRRALATHANAADDPWCDMAEAARYAARSGRTLRRHIESGLLRASKVGREWRFRRSWLDAYLSGETDAA